MPLNGQAPISEILGRQRQTEIPVVFAHQVEDAGTKRVTEIPVA